MSDSQVSIGAALSYAWSLWRTHWREVWGVLALNALAVTVLCAGLFANNLPLMFVGLLALVATQYPTYGSIYRLAFAAEHPGDDRFRLAHHGLQWRGMELKLLGSGALILLFSAVLTLLLSLVVMLALGALLYSNGIPLSQVMKTNDPFRAAGVQGLQLHSIGNDLIMLVLFFVWIRLSLSYPATAATGRVQVFRTWKLTRGHFWQLLAATLILELPSALIMTVGSGSGLALHGGPAPLAPHETFIYSLLCGGWAGAAAMPLAAGVQAYFYRNLKTAE